MVAVASYVFVISLLLINEYCIVMYRHAMHRNYCDLIVKPTMH